MHAVVMESLEEYLSGALEPAVERQIETHLSGCKACREDVANMREVGLLFGSLRCAEAVEAPPGFYAQVMARAVEQRDAPSFTNIFALNFAFGRRLAFGSLVTLAVLGSFLIVRESRSPMGPSPETVMAEEYSAAFDSAPAQDNMLLTLTAYER
ncbi:MAG: zf-HC2 domain-containing protein [Bryobacteraceae bacterium]|jgi:anti-sigma factor RsiW